MKYDVNFSCGHTETIELFGKNTERKRKIEYFEQYGMCSTCYKAQKEAEHKAEMDAYKSAELPALTGTPKQIAWAEKIRLEAYNSYANRGFEYIASETSAAWWIDRRHDYESVIFSREEDARKNAAIVKAASMIKADIFRQAHALAKKLKDLYPDTDYRANFAESLKALYAAIKGFKAQIA
jgi:hypothetical protein